MAKWDQVQVGTPATTGTVDCVSGSGSAVELDSELNGATGNTATGTERETGIVEKLLHTYGFIRCCERQARLFFHYTQFNGQVEHLKNGDAVDFEMSYDRKSGKPIAVAVTKIRNDPTHGLGGTLVTGQISAPITNECREGRVAYENCGECFFLAFRVDDQLDVSEKFYQGQSVQFLITADGAGNFQAKQVRSIPNPSTGSGASHADSAGAGQFNAFPGAFCVGAPISLAVATAAGHPHAALSTVPVIGIAPSAHHAQNGHNATAHCNAALAALSLASPLYTGGVQILTNGTGAAQAQMVAQTGHALVTGQQTLNGNKINLANPMEPLQQTQQSAQQQQLQISQSQQAIFPQKQANNNNSSNPATTTLQHSQHYSGHSTGNKEPNSVTSISTNGNNSVQMSKNPQQQYANKSTMNSKASKSQNGSQSKSLTTNSNNGPSSKNAKSANNNTFSSNSGNNNKNVSNGVTNQSTGRQDTSNNEDTGRPNPYQGVVCSLKESFGFVERADIVKEIFFHCSEFRPPQNFNQIQLGDDVSFDIATRTNREVAINLKKLPPGTVIFEDLDESIQKGTVLIVPGSTDEPLDGKLSFSDPKSQSLREIPFGDRDLSPGPFTLNKGDPVEFQLSMDRRDGLERATNITLNVNDASLFSRETRRTGTVVSLRDTFGFIACNTGEGASAGSSPVEYYFRLSEVLDSDTLRLETVVQFSLSLEQTHPNSGPPRQVAIRVMKVQSNGYQNGQAQTALGKRRSKKERDRNSTATPGSAPTGGNTSTGSERDREGKVREDRSGTDATPRSNIKYTHKGYIVAIKDHFGFIEADNRREDVFFRFSAVDNGIGASTLNLGQEVEYTLSPSHRNSKQSAEAVRPLRSGTIPAVELVSSEVFLGKVQRSLRCLFPDQTEYCGQVVKAVRTSTNDFTPGEPANPTKSKETSPDSTGPSETASSSSDSLAKQNDDIETDDKTVDKLVLTDEIFDFSVMSLAKRGDAINIGDEVEFQVATCKVTNALMAINLRPIRERKQATVEAVKGNFGFLTYEPEPGKKLFFHMSEVKGLIQPGDKVEFDISKGTRNNKFSAVNVVKIKGQDQSTDKTGSVGRPTALMSRLKAIGGEDGPKVIVLRQPRGPDGTKGFTLLPSSTPDITSSCSSTEAKTNPSVQSQVVATPVSA